MVLNLVYDVLVLNTRNDLDRPAAAAKVYSAQALVEGFIDQFVGPDDQPAKPTDESWRAVYATFNFAETPAGVLSDIMREH